VIDRAEFTAQAGDGGAGAVSFRREKFVPQGGPDGGDGGQGGSVIIEAREDLSTLQHVRFRRVYRAENGGRGGGNNRHGKSGRDATVPVPPGTIVQRRLPDGSLETIADLDRAGARCVAAYGGLGGKGNARFASPTNQAPRIAERGQRGQRAEIVLDLKLLADVGIIGVPSVGKSSLIAAVSAARPKVAEYPFTTLEPVLGVVDLGWTAFVMVDLPGLIEGAHAGAGLGHEFLRHVERTRLLVHLLDASHDDALREYAMINEELALYNPALAERPQIVALNKIDLEAAQEHLPALEAALRARGVAPIALSVATREHLPELLQRVAQELDALRGRRDDGGWAEGGMIAPENPDDEDSAVRPAPPAPTPWQDSESVADAGVPPTLSHRAAIARSGIPQQRGAEAAVLRPRGERRFAVQKLRPGRYAVEGRRLAAMAEMLNLTEDEARAEFFRRITRFGVTAALRRAGVKNGDRVRFGETEITWDFD
jgi:GTP-binding protein